MRLLQGCCNAAGAKAVYFLWQNALQEKGKSVYLHLLFTNNYEKIRVKNHIPRQGKVEIEVIDAPTLLVRTPRFVDKRTLKTIRDNKPVAAQFEKNYLKISNNVPGAKIVLNFDITEKEDSVTIGNEGFKQFTYNYRWLGDTVVKMEPKGKYSHLYDCIYMYL